VKRLLLVVAAMLVNAQAFAGGWDFFGNPPPQISVMSEGTGATRESATTNALIAAANQAVGVLVVSNKQVSDDRLVTNEIFQQTSGIVNKYEVLVCYKEDLLYTCQIRAQVSTTPLLEVLQAKGGKQFTVDGESEYAKQLTYSRNVYAAGKLLEKALEGSHDVGLSVKSQKISIRPTVKEASKVVIQARVGVDDDYLRYLGQIAKRAAGTAGDGRKVVIEIPGERTWTLMNETFELHRNDPYLSLHMLGKDGQELLQQCGRFDRGFLAYYQIQGDGRMVKVLPDRDISLELYIPDSILKDLREMKFGVGCDKENRKTAVRVI
jgi:hypothetical protein